MRPLPRLACAIVAAAALPVLGAACSATFPPPPPVPIPTLPPVASATPVTPSAAPAAPPPPAAPAEIADWADPGAVAHLAADCHWAPAAGEQSAALSCEIHPDQNCNPNECDDVEGHCYSRCTTACDACGEQCVVGCESCKRGCHDDACRRGCAEKCGACRRECLRTKDHCASAECAQEVIQCSDKLHADYDKSGCPKRVAKLGPCIEACIAKAEKAGKETDYRTSWDCQGECVSRVMPGCDRFFSFFRIY